MEALQLDAQDYVFPVEARNIFENKNIIKALLLVALIIFLFFFTLYNMSNGILNRPL